MNFLEFYVSTSAEPLGNLSLGDCTPGSSDDFVLRVGNVSSDLQAQDVTVGIDADSTTQGDQLWLSLDGDVFTASVAIGDIPPGSISAPFFLRRITPSTFDNGGIWPTGCFARVTASAADWIYPLDTSSSENVALATPDNPPDD